MTVKRNGEVINSIPVTTGKPGFSTRNGIKVVLGKEYYVQMRGDSIGIAAAARVLQPARLLGDPRHLER